MPIFLSRIGITLDVSNQFRVSFSCGIKTKRTFKKEINENGCIGSISELYDSVKPQLPKGAIAQAWSVAEIFRIIMER